jgi:hypothetical protein
MSLLTFVMLVAVCGAEVAVLTTALDLLSVNYGLCARLEFACCVGSGRIISDS